MLQFFGSVGVLTRLIAERVAPLSLTNPRDALHHGKRQISKQSRDHNHAHLGHLCRPFGNIRYSLPV